MFVFWIMLTGFLVAACCGLLGTFLVLRKMSMVGDAISHAVLPGIVIAYLVTESRDTLPMLIGAAFFGMLTTIIIELLHKKARVQSDASIGLTFTWLFAIGVILVSAYTQQVDLDQDCVLHGYIEFVSADELLLSNGVSLGPRAVWVLGATLLLIIAYIIWGYKGLFVTTFNPEFAKTIGISTSFWHYSLMAFISLTTVLSFELVGAILVVAFLIVPPATAYLYTDNLKVMLVLTVFIGLISAVGGYFLAASVNGSIAGAMAVVSGICFLVGFLTNPKQGILYNYFRKRAQPSEMMEKI